MSVQIPLFADVSAPSTHLASRVENAGRDAFDTHVLVNNFHHLVEAAGGTSQLRRLVLSLAVAGRLTSTAPVSAASDDKPFALPGTWRWMTLDACATLADGPFGSKLKKSHYVPNSRYRVVRLGNIGVGVFKQDDRAFIDKAHFASLRQNHLFEGDILVASLGNPPGRACIVPSDVLPAINKADCFRIRLSNRDLIPEYVVLVLNAPFALSRAAELHRGDTRGRITLDHLRGVPVPVPPVDEQERIVANVDELMRMLDDLEAKQAKKREVQTRLRTAALDALASTEGPDDFEAAWERIAKDFAVLFERADSVSQLSAKIADLAIRGALTHRSDADGNAKALIDKLASERARVKTRLPKLSPEVASEPFPIPKPWTWERLDRLWASITDGDHQPPPKAASGVPFLTIGNVSGGALDFSQTRFVSGEYFANLDNSRVPRRGDLLYTVVGSFGIPVVVDSDQPFCVQRHIAILRPLPSTNVQWMHLFLSSGFAYRQAAAAATGIAQPTVGLGSLRGFMVPVPPLAEQARIVEVVARLSRLCDALESKLRRSEDIASKLAEAVVAAMVT